MEDAVLLSAGLTPHTERFKPGGRLAQAAAKLGRTEGACRCRWMRIMRKSGHTGHWTTEGLWTPAEDDVITEAGRSDDPRWKAIAADLGRTEQACRTRWYNLRRHLH